MSEPQNKKTVTDSPALAGIVENFSEAVVETHAAHGDFTAIIQPDKIVAVITWLKNEPGLEFNMLMDLFGVDYLPRQPRFEVVYHLYSVSQNHRVWIKVQLDGARPEVDSITSLYKAANWFEREVWDMFGIKFNGHPDLRRILMYDQFEGHPLRRDYPIDKRQPIVEPRTEHL